MDVGLESAPIQRPDQKLTDLLYEHFLIDLLPADRLPASKREQPLQANWRFEGLGLRQEESRRVRQEVHGEIRGSLQKITLKLRFILPHRHSNYYINLVGKIFFSSTNFNKWLVFSFATIYPKYYHWTHSFVHCNDMKFKLEQILKNDFRFHSISLLLKSFISIQNTDMWPARPIETVRR